MEMLKSLNLHRKCAQVLGINSNSDKEEETKGRQLRNISWREAKGSNEEAKGVEDWNRTIVTNSEIGVYLLTIFLFFKKTCIIIVMVNLRI